jgi:predicted nucleic acid-binding protein
VTVLVDTSVWIDHLRRGNPGLVELLEAGSVACHPAVIGELACGNLANRGQILDLLSALPRPGEASFDEAIRFVNDQRLYGIGLGWIDVQLLASARLAAWPLWTLDRALGAVARRLGVALPA